MAVSGKLLVAFLRLAASIHAGQEREQMSHTAAGPTAEYYMKDLVHRRATDIGCLAQLGNLESGFSNPENSFPEQMHPGGKLYLLGDSIIGQLCQLGSPGVCCSNQRPCSGTPSYRSSTSPWEVPLDKIAPYDTQGWQHLQQFKARARNNTARNEVFLLAPAVHDDASAVSASVDLVTGFMQEKGTSDKDVLVLGMLGNHYNHGLEVFDSYISKLIRNVVNPFPGRVVLLGYSPQHFPGSGHFTGRTDQACSPSPLPGDIDPPRSSFRSSIFLANVWGKLTHPRARVVDFYELLSPLWACHRTAGDCTHWQDPVIALQAQLILNALQKI